MSTLLDLLLAQQPPILEVITHARTAKWNNTRTGQCESSWVSQLY